MYGNMNEAGSFYSLWSHKSNERTTCEFYKGKVLMSFSPVPSTISPPVFNENLVNRACWLNVVSVSIYSSW